MPNWLKDAGTVTALGVTGLGIAVAVVVIAFVVVSVASIWMGSDRRAAALEALDRLLELVSALRGIGGRPEGPPSTPPAVEAA
jgi:hypothetical protein